jgi:AcrR family transcriptional regulator
MDTPMLDPRNLAAERDAVERSAVQENPAVETIQPADPRAARTREAIFAGIETLMSSGVSRVTVRDVVRVSDVSRSSFYAHFSGLEELALAFLTRQIDIVGEDGIGVSRDDLASGVAAARIGYARLVGHVVQNFPLYASVLEVSSTRVAFEAAIDAYSRRLLRSVLTLGVTPVGVDVEVVVAYVAGGARTVISSWLRGEFDVDDDELVKQLVDLLPEWVRGDHARESETRIP